MMQSYKDLEIYQIINKTQDSRHKTQDTRLKTQDPRGQALLFVFFLLLIIGILAGALAVMWQAEIKTRTAARDGLIAFYLAQAGIERAKIDVANNPASFPDGWYPSCTDDNNPNCWYTHFTNGWYKFYVENIGGNLRRIQSRGRAVSATNNNLAERQVEVRVDISTRTKQAWSWWEM